MNISEPELYNNANDYADVTTYIQVGAQDWKFTTSLDKGSQEIYDNDVQVADNPDGEFDVSPDEPPGVVQRAYAKVRPEAVAMLEALKLRPAQQLKCAASLDAGLMHLECGTCIDVNLLYRTLAEMAEYIKDFTTEDQMPPCVSTARELIEQMNSIQ